VLARDRSHSRANIAPGSRDLRWLKGRLVESGPFIRIKKGIGRCFF
jgi:hypothetical protein